MSNFIGDLRHAVRTLRKSPGLLFIATLSLGLGTGVNSTIFSVFKGLLLAHVTAVDSGRVQHIWVGGSNRISYPNLVDLRPAKGFSALAGYSQIALNLGNGADAERVLGLVSTGNFFQLLGVNAMLGRTFSADEGLVERDPRVALLSYSTWESRFHRDRGVLGRTLNLNGYPFTVIGVLPRNYHAIAGYSIDPQIYVPLSKTLNKNYASRTDPGLELIGRMAPGFTEQQARASMLSAAGVMEKRYPKENVHFAMVDIFPIQGIGKLRHDRFLGGLVLFFAMLLVVAGLVLAIACANVAGLLLARSVNRRREIAVRLALGASRVRVVQSLLAESAILAGLGTLAGFLMSLWTTSLLRHVQPPGTDGRMDLNLQVDPDAGMLLFALAIAAASALLCGLIPALQGTRLTLGPDLNDRSAQYSRRRVTLRNALVAGQVALSLLLLATSFLFIRSLQHIGTVNPGFDVEHTLTAQIDVDDNRYDQAQKILFYERAIERLQTVPGVEAASSTAIVPLSGDTWNSTIEVPGPGGGVKGMSDFDAVAPGYFRTSGIALRRGRDFNRNDREGAAGVAIVNHNFAERFFSRREAIGQHLKLDEGRDKTVDLTVIGVAADSKYSSLGEDPKPMVYLSSAQNSMPFNHLEARVTGSPQAMIYAVKQALSELDRSAVVRVYTMRESIAFAFFPHRIAAIGLGAMGSLGLLLATIGLYGAMAYAVSRRRSEIGIRMALGADRGTVLRMVLADAFFLVATGVASGLALSLLATRALTGFLAGVSPTDPLTFIGVTALMLAIGLAASYLPARRATRVDPMISLRYE